MKTKCDPITANVIFDNTLLNAWELLSRFYRPPRLYGISLNLIFSTREIKFGCTDIIINKLSFNYAICPNLISYGGSIELAKDL